MPGAPVTATLGHTHKAEGAEGTLVVAVGTLVVVVVVVVGRVHKTRLL